MACGRSILRPVARYKRKAQLNQQITHHRNINLGNYSAYDHLELTIGPVKNVTPPNFQVINEAHKNRWLQKSAGIHDSIVHIALPVI